MLACTLVFGFSFFALAQSQLPEPTMEPLVRTIDLDVGESGKLTLCDGSTATVQLMALRETHDPFQNAVRRAEVDVKVNGHFTTLIAASYRLPVTLAGVQIDCAITRGYVETTGRQSWDLEKAARLRLSGEAEVVRHADADVQRADLCGRR
jgi:hypothetical protein